MKLWLISRIDTIKYGQYDAFVIRAETYDKVFDHLPGWYGRSWAKNIEHVKVEYLGEAVEGSKAGEVLSSFNAE